MLIDLFVDSDKPIESISPNKIVTSGIDDKIFDVLRLMLTDKYRKIPIIDNEHNIKGIVTSIDILNLISGGKKYDMFEKNKMNIDALVGQIATTTIKAIRPDTSIKKSILAFKNGQFGTYPLVRKNKLISIVSEWDFVKLVNKPIGVKVYEAMTEKPMFAKKKYTVMDVAKMMCRGGYRRLPVVDDGIIIGIVTPMDILLHVRRHSIENKLSRDKTLIGSIMNREIISISDNVDLFSAIKEMKNKRVGGLPVIEDDHLVGIITERDILEVLA